MTEGRLLKPDQDFSKIVEEELPQISQLALPQAIERLTVLEKQTRQASDAISTKHILVKVVQLCAGHEEWETLNDQILAFTKKHGQLKAAAQGMVAEAWGILRSKDWKGEGKIKERGKLIETLRVVTEGKVFCLLGGWLTVGVCGSGEGESHETVGEYP
jgi:26S proteasome regulatory subunit N5